ncbi:hypothetical protein HY484_04095, partial [Candidatus Woesearchaeota archaeon]|nr:hypothetical protein [Candidatus Woesearchaeota archaeon]
MLLTQTINAVIKRDGRQVSFDTQKITAAITKAAFAVNQPINTTAVTTAVLETLSKTYTNEQPPTVEQISDTVEQTLIEHKHADIAKAYILYRQKRTEERTAK